MRSDKSYQYYVSIVRAYPVDTPKGRWYDFSLCKWISFNTTTSRFRALFQSSSGSFLTVYKPDKHAIVLETY